MPEIAFAAYWLWQSVTWLLLTWYRSGSSTSYCNCFSCEIVISRCQKASRVHGCPFWCSIGN